MIVGLHLHPPEEDLFAHSNTHIPPILRVRAALCEAILNFEAGKKSTAWAKPMGRIVESGEPESHQKWPLSTVTSTRPVSPGRERLVWLSSDDFAAGKAAHEMLAEHSHVSGSVDGTALSLVKIMFLVSAGANYSFFIIIIL